MPAPLRDLLPRLNVHGVVRDTRPQARLALEGGTGPAAVEKFRRHPQAVNAAEDGPLYWENVAALREALARQPSAVEAWAH